MKKIVLLGAGGHCKVIIDIIRSNKNYKIIGITNKDNGGNEICDIPIIGKDDLLKGCFDSGVENAFIALGGLEDRGIRNKLFNMAKVLGYKIPALIHAKAIVSSHASIGEGTCVMPGVIINSGVCIGKNCIINSGAVIEHDCVIGNNTHISPNVSIAGGVKIGNDTHIGIGSTVIQNLSIGCNVTIGAGAVVIDNIKSGVVAVGIPAKIIREMI